MRPRLCAAGASLALVLAVAATYGRTLRFGFVWDDHLQIEQNPWLRDRDGFARLFTEPSWGFEGALPGRPSSYFRPLFIATYALAARAFGTAPPAFHALSIALHAAVTLLVAALARRLYGRSWAGLAAGLLFALHPAHAEAVSWVAVQGDLLCAFCALVALASYLREPRTPWSVALCAVATLLACLAKETGLGVLPVLAVVEWVRAGSTDGRSALRRLGSAATNLAPVVGAASAYVVLRLNALGSLVPGSHPHGGSLVAAGARCAANLWEYAAHLCLPGAFAQRVLGRAPEPTVLSVAGGALLAGAAAWIVCRRRSPLAVVVPVAWALCFLSPVLAAHSLGELRFSERYLYLPSIGLAWLAGGALTRVANRGSSQRACVLTACAAALVGSAVVAARRSATFRDDASYFRAAAAGAPDDPVARNGLGIVLGREGDLGGAQLEHEAALALDSASVVTWTNLGGVRERRGDVAGAMDAYEQALARDPRHDVAGAMLARLHRRSGNDAEAARLLDNLIASGRATYDVLVDRASLWLDQGRPAEARALLESALSRFPEAPRGHYLLAQALFHLGDLEAAWRAAQAAIARGAGPAPRRLLALIRARQGRLAEAQALAGEALRLAPEDAQSLALRDRLERAAPRSRP